MSTQSWRRLLIVAALLIVGVIVLDNASDDSRTAGGERLLPALSAQMNDIKRVVVRYPDASATLANEDSTWVVREKDDYPADTGSLRQVLIALNDAQRLEQKTANPALHARLGLAESGDGAGVRLTISGDGFEHALVIGDVAQQNYRYVRLADDDQAWLVDQNPQLPDGVSGWLAADILDLPAARVQSVSIDHEDGAHIEFAKTSADDTAYTVADLPEGRELSFPGVVNGTAGALLGLALDDVRRRPDDLPAARTRTQWTTFDGLRITAESYALDGDPWLSFAAEALDAPGTDNTPADEPDATADDEATDDDVPVSEQADDINRRVAAWLYRLPDNKVRLIERRWADLLKALPDESSE